MNNALDAFDLRLLTLLQEDARLTHAELGERIHLSASQVSRRLQRLIDHGIIRHIRAELDAGRLGMGLKAYCLVTLKAHGAGRMRDFYRRVMALPQIIECQSLTGEADYLLKVVTPDLKAFSDFISNDLLKASEVAHVRTSIVLESIKENAPYALDHLKPHATKG
ncbi:MAG TPA: Lrp/AsnC family transcriptional regulator [Dongiaceae bacterium]|jgi:DNA-binding Lrp family transcriptional regulator|nr:Lrp/AsnC family transcriptional regulator [Dongiaceae bacterium]